MPRRRPGTVQPPQQGIEALLQRLVILTLASQGAQQFGNHLLEHRGIVGQGRGVQDGRQGGRGSWWSWCRWGPQRRRDVRAHTLGTRPGGQKFKKARKNRGKS